MELFKVLLNEVKLRSVKNQIRCKIWIENLYKFSFVRFKMNLKAKGEEFEFAINTGI